MLKDADDTERFDLLKKFPGSAAAHRKCPVFSLSLKPDGTLMPRSESS
ncbi:MAG: hypothetical protein ABW185_11595 [Sedimenticola sp.]